MKVVKILEARNIFPITGKETKANMVTCALFLLLHFLQALRWTSDWRNEGQSTWVKE